MVYHWSFFSNTLKSGGEVVGRRLTFFYFPGYNSKDMEMREKTDGAESGFSTLDFPLPLIYNSNMWLRDFGKVSGERIKLTSAVPARLTIIKIEKIWR